MIRYFKEMGAARIIWTAAVLALQALSGVVGAFALSVLIDSATAAIAQDSISPIIMAAGLAIAYAVADGVLRGLAAAVKAGAARQVMLAVRRRAAGGLLVASADGSRQNSADAITLLGQSMETVASTGVEGVFTVFDSSVSMVCAFVSLMLINPLLGAIAIAMMVVPAVLPKLFESALAGAQGRIMERATAYNSRVRDMMQGLDVLRSFGAIGRAAGLHESGARDLEGAKVHLARVTGLLLGTAQAGAAAVQFSIMAIAAWFAVNGLISVGSIVAVAQLAANVIQPGFNLASVVGQIKSVRPILAQIDGLLARGVRGGNAPEPVPVNASVELGAATFAYPGSDPVVRDASLTVEAGRKYAIVGGSGSGKSTVLGLLSGALALDSGELSVDGVRGARPDCAVIHQDVFLFDDTLRANIALWGEHTDEEVMRAAREAGLGDLLDALPQGLDTPVEEGGARFSGGERQRIAIARALLHRKGLLLVDEATSALDEANARRIDDLLLGLEGVAVVAVTHRLDERTAGRYDAVLEMAEGRLAPRAA